MSTRLHLLLLKYESKNEGIDIQKLIQCFYSVENLLNAWIPHKNLLNTWILYKNLTLVFCFCEHNPIGFSCSALRSNILTCLHHTAPAEEFLIKIQNTNTKYKYTCNYKIQIPILPSGATFLLVCAGTTNRLHPGFVKNTKYKYKIQIHIQNTNTNSALRNNFLLTPPDTPKHFPDTLQMPDIPRQPLDTLGPNLLSE